MIDTRTRAVVVTAVLTAVFIGSVLLTGGLQRERLPLDLALLGLNTLPLLFLHRWPLAVVATLCVAYPLWLESGQHAHIFQSLPTLVALYALGSAEPLSRWARGFGLAVPVYMMLAVLTNWWDDAQLVEVGYIAVMFALVWGLGVVVAARRSYIRQLEEQTRALRSARQELAERAVADERTRIARELHDVVAHAMSLITVRAGVGAHLLTARPAATAPGAAATPGAAAPGESAKPGAATPAEAADPGAAAQAAEALRVIERTGREALMEMRRMLAVLRAPGPGTPETSPPSGLADLPRLLAQVRDAGLTAELAVTGEPAPLPPGLDLAAYRVVQEALTNVVKHGAGGPARVAVRHLPESVELDIHNAGRYLEPATPGMGMRGMAERVAIYDGELTAGPVPDGFRVSARLPRPDLPATVHPATGALADQPGAAAVPAEASAGGPVRPAE